ncbi:hypothetical protein HanIR_Chr09g0437181 [Helianthus annuus]|nr:hypothetical protein HanIR_Chr09g0437181 [Helianthus annuus]
MLFINERFEVAHQMLDEMLHPDCEDLVKLRYLLKLNLNFTALLRNYCDFRVRNQRKIIFK